MREAVSCGVWPRANRPPSAGRPSFGSPRERLEGRLQPLEGIGVLVPGGAAHAALAQAGDAVALGVDAARRGRGVLRMQQVPVLGGEQEDQAVDEAEQLLEIGLRGEVAAVSAWRSAVLARCSMKPWPAPRAPPRRPGAACRGRRPPRSGRARASARAGSRRARHRARRSGSGGSGARRREVGEQAVGEDLREIGLDPGRAGQADVVAHQAERQAVGRETPERGLVGVQVFLQEEVAERRRVPSAS